MDAKKVVVVGGGPAGIMAAIRAGQLNCAVTLIEKNPLLGKKLLLSGKGRCNLTNACDLDSFLLKFPRQGQFLRDAFKKFFNRDLMAFFEKRGLRLNTERQLRVFPVSNKSDSIIKVLKEELQKNKVTLMYNCQIRDVFMQENRIKGLLLKDTGTIPADKLILATGGISYGFTGSTGYGIALARRLGHRIIPLSPGLVPLETKEAYPKLLKGLTLKNIRLKFSDGETNIISQVGELLFTQSGISGPLVLSLSGQVVDWLNEKRHVYVEIDLKPALSREQLNARILREFQVNPRRNLKNILKALMPARLGDVFIGILKILPDRKASHVRQEERQDLVTLLKAWRLDITKSRPIDEAMVTRGGVSLKDIDPRTMQSRLIKGLYFAGEMIDMDADTGGFNLQAAFSTGYLAGESAALN